jgi:hypothetical protein
MSPASVKFAWALGHCDIWILCRFTLVPPDGEAKPGLARCCMNSGMKYNGTMNSHAPREVPSVVLEHNDTRFACLVCCPHLSKEEMFCAFLK